MFDEKTEEKLKYYVYGLINPLDGKLFYVGKGTGNRVFMHLKDAIKEDSSNLKLDIIRSVISKGLEIKHLILRHGLSEKEAFEVESTLIDFGDYFKYNFSNIVAGANSDKRGIMTSNEIIRKYNSKPLKELLHPVIIININKKYNRGINPEEIYKATKEAWVIGNNKTNIVKYALAEFEGIIIEVYKIKDWYRVKPKDFNDRNNDFKIKANSKVRWGFDGDVAEESVRTIYLNKSIAHVKKQGAANPIRYTLDKPNPYLKINNKQSKRIVKLNKVVKVRTENRMKIGAFVQDSFRKAYEQNLITEDEIKRLQNPEYSKRIFNAGFEVLRFKSASIKDGGGRTRYYAKELFCEDYHLSQQWKETQRDSFLMWLKQIGYSN
tara:strand:+ start:33 stop:1169 length:1137 start_codon:yes stop_codon:yes gene_type:complete